MDIIEFEKLPVGESFQPGLNAFEERLLSVQFLIENFINEGYTLEERAARAQFTLDVVENAKQVFLKQTN